MKIICIGRNFVEHIKELKNEVPESMVIFLKPESSLHNISSPWELPSFSDDVHYECEIVLKIHKTGKNIHLEEVKDYFNEISLGIDFTARDIQSKLKEKGLPWEKAKAFDGAALVGDFISKNNFDLNNLNFKLFKNNVEVQNGHTNHMIHSFYNIICELSRYFTLEPGDLIFTGTPSGVGAVLSGDEFVGKIEEIQVFNFKVR